MPPEKHAVLSASSASRWIHCPPSVRLCESMEDEASTFAAEGTDAHALCEHKLRVALGLTSEDPTDHLTYYNEEMEECADEYVLYITRLLSEIPCTDPLVLVEQRVDFSRYVPEGFGTSDCLIVADGTLYVIDYKHGMGVEVSAKNNPQMMCYALGALELFDDLYDIEDISMIIFQPRRSHFSASTISREELLLWAGTELTPCAKLAFDGEGEFSSGEWCRFCKAKSQCRERAAANLELAAYDFQDPPLLTDEDIEDILGRVDDLLSWASDVKEFALCAALGGKQWTNYKLVEGRSYRRYMDEAAVITAVKNAGYDPYEHKLLGVTAMTRLLGTKQFHELLGELTYKPQGKPTLVARTDKRQELAITDFDEF